MGRQRTWLVLLIATGAGAQQPVTDTPYDIQAPRFEYAEGLLVATGGVTGRFDQATVTADRLTGNPETGEINLIGNIFFERDNVIWYGDELTYNYISETGNFGPSRMEFDPFRLEAEQIERTATNAYRLQGAQVSTCPKEHRHYHLRAREARLVDGNHLTAKGATLHIGRVPVLYLPYWRQYLQSSPFSFDAGYGSDIGTFLRTGMQVPVAKTLESETRLHLYSRRGAGIEQVFSWNREDSSGTLKGFYLDDSAPYTRYDAPDERTLIDRNRYHLKFDEQHRFSPTHYIGSTWSYLSDPAVVEEFFRDEYLRYAQPENRASWVYGSGLFGTEIYASRRLNGFYENTDRFQAALDFYRLRIPGTPLFYQSESQMALLQRQYQTGSPRPDYDSFRMHTVHGLYLPQRVGFFSVVPRATSRATFYSDTTSPGKEAWRSVPSAGVEASFQAAKVLSERPHWYGNGLRHVLRPYADYNYAVSTLATNRLFQFDEIDQIEDANRLRLGLNNLLQTRREKHPERLMELDVYTHYLPSEKNTDRSFEQIYLEGRMPLTKRFLLDLQGVMDTNRRQSPLFNTRLVYHTPEVVLSLEHFHREDAQSLWTSHVNLFPGQRIAFEGFARYEGRSGGLEEVALTAFASRCCIRYGIGYHLAGNDEHRLMFSIGLSTFPDVRLGRSL